MPACNPGALCWPHCRKATGCYKWADLLLQQDIRGCLCHQGPMCCRFVSDLLLQSVHIVESGLFEQSVGNRAAARLYCCRDYSNSLSACMCHATSGVCTCIVAGTVLSHNYKDCLVFTIVYSPHVEGVLLYICGANLKGNTLRVLVLS